jgi:hypothetical protein
VKHTSAKEAKNRKLFFIYLAVFIVKLLKKSETAEATGILRASV